MTAGEGFNYWEKNDLETLEGLYLIPEVSHLKKLENIDPLKGLFLFVELL